MLHTYMRMCDDLYTAGSPRPGLYGAVLCVAMARARIQFAVELCGRPGESAHVGLLARTAREAHG